MLTEFHMKGVHTMTVDIGRIYDNKDNTDAIRILVDRVWPRGISKRTANLDYWLKDIAPSTELRQWFQHDPKLLELLKKNMKKNYVIRMRKKMLLKN